jgi:dienelactone hydrolase
MGFWSHATMTRSLTWALALTLTVSPLATPTVQAKTSTKPQVNTHIQRVSHIQSAHIRAGRKHAPKRNMLGNAKPDHVSFQSGGKTIRVDVFRAADGASGRKPAVMMLHGAGGIGGGLMIYPQAKALAAHGISAFVVSYYDGLSEKVSKASAALFDKRDRVIEDALSFIAAQDYVNPDAIGVFGISLGGFHGISLAARDWRVAALVNVFGAVPQTVSPTLTHMPPTLVMHGDQDRIVPIAHSRALDARLTSLGVPHELVVYKGEGHCFNGQALTDSIERTVNFFDEHLATHDADDADYETIAQP